MLDIPDKEDKDPSSRWWDELLIPLCQLYSLPLTVHSDSLRFLLLSAAHIILSLEEMQGKKDQNGVTSQRPKLASLHLAFKQPHTAL